MNGGFDNYLNGRGGEVHGVGRILCGMWLRCLIERLDSNILIGVFLNSGGECVLGERSTIQYQNKMCWCFYDMFGGA